MPSKVYLVGAGPGDPELLTLKAARILQEADVVVYDNLISPKILKLIPKTAKKYFAGKKRSQHLMKQAEINQLLVELAKDKKYKKVVRLKGGDPFIFGRGGEEAEELVKNKIRFEVVPGITSASACGAALGIPLTHRDYVSGVHFFTGHGCKDIEPGLRWDVLANEDKTLVIYMGLHNIKTIVKRLVEHGMDKNIDAAVVERGTLPNQRHFYSKLKDLPKLLEKEEIESPALIIIGKVVGFSKSLLKQ
jgi:uroporphyrin-III C-methyltransferase/precorrin-2 dehydrogenase/sirohydrochlorin ferrochelatase